MCKISAIVLSAGQGLRMGSETPKQYLEINGLPVIIRTLKLLMKYPKIQEIILVVDTPNLEGVTTLVKNYSIKKIAAIVPGGLKRSHSVYQGLVRVSEDASLVVVHDGVRPFFTSALLDSLIDKAKERGAAIPGVPVKDTIKVCDENGKVVFTPPREALWAIQTPQVFRKDWLVKAHELAKKEGLTATDDAGLLEELGKPVQVIMGEYENIKLTTPEDLLLAEGIIRRGI